MDIEVRWRAEGAAKPTEAAQDPNSPNDQTVCFLRAFLFVLVE